MKQLPYFLSIFFIAACSKEPGVAGLKKDHSIEITFETKRLGDGSVELLTYQNVYLKGSLVKTDVKRDTLPAPGDSLQNVDVDGDEKTLIVPKEYEFFVTVK